MSNFVISFLPQLPFRKGFTQPLTAPSTHACTHPKIIIYSEKDMQTQSLKHYFYSYLHFKAIYKNAAHMSELYHDDKPSNIHNYIIYKYATYQM